MDPCGVFESAAGCRLRAAGCEVTSATERYPTPPRRGGRPGYLPGDPRGGGYGNVPGPGEPEPYLIHLPGGLPGGSPADHPDEVVLDTSPLRNACKFILFWKHKGALDLRTRIGRPPLQENSGKSYWGLEIR